MLGTVNYLCGVHVLLVLETGLSRRFSMLDADI